MAEDYSQQMVLNDRIFSDINTRIRDLEERQNLQKDRMLLISDSFVKEREKNFDEIQELRKTVEILKTDSMRIKEVLLRIGERLEKSARREELSILQRQFDLFREN